MRSRGISMFLFELIRALTSMRWAIGIVVWLLAAKLGSDAIESAKYGVHGVDWTALDIHAAAMNDSFVVGFLLLPAFVLIAGDSVGRDRESRYVHVTMPRVGDKRSWWSSKIAVLLVSSLVFQAGVLAACFAVGWYGGAELSIAPSTFARADYRTDEGAPRVLFAPVGTDTNMIVREVSRAAYLVLAFFAVGVVLTLASLRYSSGWFPAGMCIAFVMTDWLAGGLLPSWYAHIGLVGRMLEGIHSPIMVTPALSWGVSIAAFTCLGVAAYAFGRVVVTRVDL